MWFFFIAFSAYAYQYQPVLESLSIIGISPGVENVIFTFNKINNYRFIMLSNNYWYIAVPQYTIHINQTPTPRLSVNDILVRDIRNETRIYIKMNDKYTYKYKPILSKNGKYLIVRIEKLFNNTSNKAAKPKTQISHKQTAKTVINLSKPSTKTPVIVIDPGHGGKDPGAIGIYNKEKNIVLDIAKRTAYYLKRKGYKVVLTRNKDTYPTLSDRSQLSNRVKANIFVSIHANYSVKDRKKAKGLEVYFLNTTSDKRAIRLAARENGISIQEVGDINKIILSLIQSAKIEKSKTLALDVYYKMLSYGKKIYAGYKGRGVKQAPFYVLVDTRCPSILIETAFINNPKDALYLKNPVFRKYLAIGIAKGIETYIHSHMKSKIKQ